MAPSLPLFTADLQGARSMALIERIELEERYCSALSEVFGSEQAVARAYLSSVCCPGGCEQRRQWTEGESAARAAALQARGSAGVGRFAIRLN